MPPLRYACLILLVALAVRLAAGYYFQSRLAKDHPFEFGDSEGYWALGQALALGKPYQFAGARVFRAPGYPLLLSGMFHWVGADAVPLWGRGLSALAGAATVLAAMWWASLLFNQRAALCAGWLTALYPGSIALGACVLSEAPFCLLMVLQLAFWTRAWRGVAGAGPANPTSGRRRFLWWGAAGIAAGAASLTRPSWLLFTPLALLAVLALDSRERRQNLAGGLVMLAVLTLVMCPWWIRNWQVTGRFVVTTLQVGASLYDGLNPQADGSSNMSFVPVFEAVERNAEGFQAERSADGFEYRLDRRLRQAAWDWARTHQGRAVQLAFIKLARMWNVWPNEPTFRGWPLRLAVLFSYGPLVVAGVYVACRLAKAGGPYVLCWLPAVYLSLLHMVFIGSLRYREPPMLGLIVLAAAACLLKEKRPFFAG